MFSIPDVTLVRPSNIQLEKIDRQLGLRTKGRSVVLENDRGVLKESLAIYKTLFEGKKSTLRPGNSYFWDINHDNSG